MQKRLEDWAIIQQVAGDLLSVGSTVASTIFEIFTLAILTLYFLAYLRDITAFAYRLTPASRPQRVSRIGDSRVAQIGAYVVGTRRAGAAARRLAPLVFLGSWGALPVRAGLHRGAAGPGPGARHGAGRSWWSRP